MKRLSILLLFIIITSLITGCAKQVTGDDVVKSFKNAGLQAENPSPMTKDDYGLAPYVCKGTHFFVPSIDPTAGGRVFICDNDKDRDLLNSYYTELGRSSAIFFSWVFVKGNVLVQINGDLPENTARKYEAVIP
jgi:hypothetical protein